MVVQEMFGGSDRRRQAEALQYESGQRAVGTKFWPSCILTDVVHACQSLQSFHGKLEQVRSNSTVDLYAIAFPVLACAGSDRVNGVPSRRRGLPVEFD